MHTKPKPVIYQGHEYRSIEACARALGCDPKSIKRALAGSGHFYGKPIRLRDAPRPIKNVDWREHDAIEAYLATIPETRPSQTGGFTWCERPQYGGRR